jgi:N-acetylmuramoyl-L-alanine amidase
VSVSPNFNDRPSDVPIDMLVVHYTGMESCDHALARLCDSDAKVSAHYLIEEDGTVHRLVDEDKRAWHAGVSWWRGAMDVNGRSIGIELVNPGHEFGYQTFPDMQMQAFIALSQSILRRHPIPPRNVVGHSDVAPRRKTDPGELFDWRRLAEAGVGLWVEQSKPMTVSDYELAAMLSSFGYEIAERDAPVAAFQRHFRPRQVDGVADAETVGLLKALLDAL